MQTASKEIPTCLLEDLRKNLTIRKVMKHDSCFNIWTLSGSQTAMTQEGRQTNTGEHSTTHSPQFVQL